jgi:hypothetical protein
MRQEARKKTGARKTEKNSRRPYFWIIAITLRGIHIKR